MAYLGDFADNATVYFAFTLNDSSGGRASFSATIEQADVTIYKNATAMTLDASTITITAEPGSQTGVHICAVDMNNDADFATGSDYIAVLYPNDETVDSQNVAAVLAQWSCQNRYNDVNAATIGAGAIDDTSVGTLAASNFSFVDANDRVDVGSWLGTAVTTSSSTSLPEVDTKSISDDATAADNLEASLETMVTGTATGSLTSTTMADSALTEATDNHYNGRVIVWRTGVLTGQATDITAYNGSTKTFTFTEVTDAPGSSDAYVIV